MRFFQDLRSKASRSFPPNLARLMLLCCAALWGGSYLVSKMAMRTIAPQSLMALRMFGACIVMLILFRKSILPSLNRFIIVPALLTGVTYWGTLVPQNIGLQTIDPGRSAFLTAAYCVLTPFAAWIISRTKPRAINLIAGVICLAGVGFVALKPGSGGLTLSSGDWLTLLCAVVFSFNLTLLGVYSRTHSPIAVTFAQFAVAGVLFFAGALLTEPAPTAAWLEPGVIASFLYLLFGATTAAQIMQNIGLAHVPADSASIIMCTESLFSVVFAAIFWGEIPGWNALIGFAMIFVAMILSARSQESH